MDTSINKDGVNTEMDLFETIRVGMNLKQIDPINYSPLTLAYIGDAVYELIVRTIVVDESNKAVNKLHKESSNLVKADAQCRILHAIMDKLSEEEQRIYKRGRNAKSYTKAKNASYSDYRQATGFEALVGYLYICNRTERLMELIKGGIDSIR